MTDTYDSCNSKQRLVVKAFCPDDEKMSECVNNAETLETRDVFFEISGELFDTKIEIFYLNEEKFVADKMLKIFIEGLSSSVYAMEDITLPELVNKLLKLRNKTISVSESFTAGRVSSSIISIPGASAHFHEGIVAYSNLAKRNRLNVSERTLCDYGAVSAECAAEMVNGLLDTNECDIALSTTGIAGPRSDNSNKPVGLCYFGVGEKGSVRTYELFLKGDRETITETAVRASLFFAVKALKYM